MALLVLAAALLSSCVQQRQSTSADITALREVTDDLGRSVKIPLKVERAISLAPNLTESIFAIGAGDRLVGVTTYCNYPAEAQAIQKVSDTQTPNIESIIALKPQVVFVSTASQLETFASTLERQNIAVFVTNPTNLANVLKNLTQLGDIFGTSQIASRVVSGLQRRVDAVREEVAEKASVRVFVQFSREPLFTIGRESFLTEIIDAAGGESVTKDIAMAYPKLSKETALALNPDAIILSDSEDNREPNAVFENSTAVRSGRVYRIHPDLISRPGPRIVDAVEQIAGELH